MKNKKTLMIVLGIFALVIVTTAASFAFFTYSRVGNTKATIISGDIEFSYIEGDSAELVNAFPIADEVGAIDISGEYDFQVKLNSSGATTASYNVYLVDNNEGTNHFKNEQIKFALIKNDVFVANTSATEGVKLSTLDGFDEGSYNGEGLVLEEQEISSGEADNYKLRIWISDDVTYTNEYLSSGTMDGKYNSYTYSLKVKVTSGITNSITIGDIAVNGNTITAEVSDPNGISAYAVTDNSAVPASDSDEWIEITSDTAKSNVVRTAADLITSKTIKHKLTTSGIYYLHVKNSLNETKSKKVDVEITGILASEYIIDLASKNTHELRIDTHAATGQQTFATTEYRYWGSNPKNYVEFNDEMWRIIGVFDVDDGTGKIEQRVKIIRDDSIGSYSWDTSDSSINNGNGVNGWSQADLMTLLNSGAYYNRTTGTCYSSYNNTTTSCDFTSTGLTSEAKEMIGNAKWYLGAHTTNSVTSSDMYGYERSTASSKQCTQGDTYCNDEVERKTNWIGQVGLMYPSDYGYAADMTSCSGTNLSSYNTSCASTDWLFNSAYQWTISPRAYSSSANYVFLVSSSGDLNRSFASNVSGVRPVTYLTADIKIIGGTGESGDNAFKLSK